MVQFGQAACGDDADRGLRRSVVDHVLPFLRRPIETAALFEVLSRLKMHFQRRLVAVGIELQGLAGRLFRGGRIAAANLGFGNEIEQIGRLGDRRLAALFHEARRRPVLLLDQPIQQSGQFGRFAAAELDQPFDAAGGVGAAIDLPQGRNLEPQQALDDGQRGVARLPEQQSFFLGGELRPESGKRLGILPGLQPGEDPSCRSATASAQALLRALAARSGFRRLRRPLPPAVARLPFLPTASDRS